MLAELLEMFVIDENEGLSPKQIHEKNIKRRMALKADEIRKQIQTERNIKILPEEVKKQIKLNLLKINGYNNAKPIKGQTMKVRILYHLLLKDMHKNRWIKEYYEAGGHDDEKSI